ncbi:MAG: hypothetical protein Q7R49_03205 [Candidatus Daviesbacteria bacterium]|nr:hypothetical protein [Candidatus Daviesbacteria bacterium]
MPNSVLTLIFGISSIILLVLFLKELLENQGLKKDPTKVLQDAQIRGNALLQQAVDKSQQIIGNSEAQALKASSAQLSQLQQEFKVYLQQLGNQAQGSVGNREQLIEQKINQLFEKFEENLSTFLTQTQQQSVKSIELEMQAARQLIQTYKQQQFKLIDENIVAMLERTLSLVLVKKLSLKEQVDLVYESLEKAKAEKFIM